MLLSVVLLFTLAVTSSSASPQRNVSSALKNGTGAAHWFPFPPFYGPPGSPLVPPYYPPQSGPLSPPSYYSQQPTYSQPQTPPQGSPPNYGPAGFGGPNFGFGPVQPYPQQSLPAEIPPYALDHYYCSAQASFALVNGGGAQPFGPSVPSMPFPSTGGSFNGPEVGLLPPGGALPEGGSSGASSNPLSGATRQFCRYTATLDDHACNYCCKIAARHYSTSIDEVTGILFAFDPDMPPVLPVSPLTGASLNRKKRAPGKTMRISPDDESTKPTTATERPPPGDDGTALSQPLPPVLPVVLAVPPEPPVPRKIPQCFCCAPKKFFGFL